MKTLITALAIALTVAGPTFAQPFSEQAIQQQLALGNDSAAERIVHPTSIGDIVGSQVKFASTNTSAAEQTVRVRASDVTRSSQFDAVHRQISNNARAKFALSNDSAAEQYVYNH